MNFQLELDSMSYRKIRKLPIVCLLYVVFKIISTHSNCYLILDFRLDMPTLSTNDVMFVSNVLMNLLHMKNVDGITHIANSTFTMITSFTFSLGRQTQTVSPAMSQICFLGECTLKREEITVFSILTIY